MLPSLKDHENNEAERLKYRARRASMSHSDSHNGLVGGIVYNSRSAVLMIRGTLMGQSYVNSILRSLLGSSLNGFSRGNVSARLKCFPPHCLSSSRLSMSCLDSCSVTLLLTDLSPEEHL
ncbi:hypothetical protein TNIN_137521 [Trichonephila inaurata madagascariensis]|uniref:Uncharacterized protein n=1 Tax=Trichonephila inaurata madagascariensis TaxID=2747483 RepID=A0A8X7CD58_9ARAC|nr:hypothetical protein TNIN_137521 [Trichonephila inaurata madagascariensis]